eukprot:TRINITY_DN5646_c0_g1_i3.p1 TRINITY_DN5646_c0_g1~~TRINITY_DN5646_c0_g1_i3.p1  ORF type:complete len:370 (+),score=53.26 TRINITY_DN5646_c0_g1_i3:242-1351(+)
MEHMKMWGTNLAFKLKYNDTFSITSSVRRVRTAPESTAGTPFVIMGGERITGDMNFHQRYKDLFWFSYRVGFKPVAGRITSDAGFGCLIRVAQSMLAETIKRHLGLNGAYDKHKERVRILSLFLDNELDHTISPFSLRRMCEIAHEICQLRPGEWFRGSTASLVLEEAVKRGLKDSSLSNFRIFAFIQGAIELHQLDRDMPHEKEEESKESNQKTETGALLMISTMLGLDEVNPDYYAPILDILALPQSVGILGGEGNKALYFFGFQGDRLLFLDPHYVQPALKGIEDLNDPRGLGTYEPHGSYSLELRRMQTSVTLCFYVQNRADLDDLIARMRQLEEQHQDNWFLSLIEGPLDDLHGCDMEDFHPLD